MKRWYLRLVKYSRPNGLHLGEILFLTFLGAGLAALTPWPMKVLVDSVLGTEPYPQSLAWISETAIGDAKQIQVAVLSVSTVIIFLLSQALSVRKGYVSAGLGSQMVYDLGAHLFAHLQRLSMRFHGHKPTGDLVKRVIKDSGCIRDVVLGIFLPITTSTINLLIMFIIMWRLDIPLTIVAILVAPFIWGLIQRFKTPMTELSYAYEELRGEVMSFSEQNLVSIPIVQAFNMGESQTAKYKELFSKTKDAYLESIRSKSHFSVGVSSSTAAGTALIMLIGGLRVNQGASTLGDLLVFLSYLASLYSPIQTLAYISSGFASAQAKAQRVLDVLDSEDMITDTAWVKPVLYENGKYRGQVRLEGVTFGYEPDKPVLIDVSLEAKPGETIALVGRTGAGKSTLVSIIPRLYDPWEGCVLIEEEDVLTLPLEYVRSQVAFVLQDSYLLPLTIAENIAYGRPDASMEEIEAAAIAANADEFITQLPSGYETVIGEQGATLSGGERQRISIARAFITNSPILILDEPTSALDVETEASLLEALERVKEGRTTFIIAHRLSTIKNADKIIVLEEGRILEQGNHKELYLADGAYRKFFDLQFGHLAAGVDMDELWTGEWHE